MVEPLRDPATFRATFLSLGVPSWPNGLLRKIATA